MTYEEAIEILQEERDWAQQLSYVNKALDVAKEALEKQITSSQALDSTGYKMRQLTEEETVNKSSFEEKLSYYKKEIKEFFDTYENKSGSEDCIEVCLIRAGYRTVLEAEKEINRQKAEIERLTNNIQALIDSLSENER